MSLSPAELQAIGAAARWYARLRSGIASDSDLAAWNDWLAGDPAHRQAWQRMVDVSEQMASVPGSLASPALRGADRSRRQVLRSVLVLASAGSLGWLGLRSETSSNLFADFRTAVGERRVAEDIVAETARQRVKSALTVEIVVAGHALNRV